MHELSPLQLVAQQVAAVLMLLGAAAFMWQPVWATVLFAVGALVFAPLQMLQRYDGRSFIIRRLRRQQLLGALALLVTACLMIMQTFRVGFARRNEWVVALAVACVLELYTAFRIPAELKKE
ncbi:MAG: hypothetical protein IJ209_06100 [Bacteroidaceae bacterium]|nr:hypothetical protein [Bacteroidaceae bacterium]